MSAESRREDEIREWGRDEAEKAVKAAFERFDQKLPEILRRRTEIRKEERNELREWVRGQIKEMNAQISSAMMAFESEVLVPAIEEQTKARLRVVADASGEIAAAADTAERARSLTETVVSELAVMNKKVVGIRALEGAVAGLKTDVGNHQKKLDSIDVQAIADCTFWGGRWIRARIVRGKPGEAQVLIGEIEFNLLRPDPAKVVRETCGPGEHQIDVVYQNRILSTYGIGEEDGEPIPIAEATANLLKLRDDQEEVSRHGELEPLYSRTDALLRKLRKLETAQEEANLYNGKAAGDLNDRLMRLEEWSTGMRGELADELQAFGRSAEIFNQRVSRLEDYAASAAEDIAGVDARTGVNLRALWAHVNFAVPGLELLAHTVSQMVGGKVLVAPIGPGVARRMMEALVVIGGHRGPSEDPSVIHVVRGESEDDLRNLTPGDPRFPKLVERVAENREAMEEAQPGGPDTEAEPEEEELTENLEVELLETTARFLKLPPDRILALFFKVLKNFTQSKKETPQDE